MRAKAPEFSTACRDAIVVRGLRVWAHVGVLERERLLGQWFEITFRIGADLTVASRSDDLADCHDYSVAISKLQAQARSIRCRTLEHYSERILDLLEEIYGPVPLWLDLVKCRPPIAGFSGTVTLHRERHRR